MVVHKEGLTCHLHKEAVKEDSEVGYLPDHMVLQELEVRGRAVKEASEVKHHLVHTDPQVVDLPQVHMELQEVDHLLGHLEAAAEEGLEGNHLDLTELPGVDSEVGRPRVPTAHLEEEQEANIQVALKHTELAVQVESEVALLQVLTEHQEQEDIAVAALHRHLEHQEVAVASSRVLMEATSIDRRDKTKTEHFEYLAFSAILFL